MKKRVHKNSSVKIRVARSICMVLALLCVLFMFDNVLTDQNEKAGLAGVYFGLSLLAMGLSDGLLFGHEKKNSTDKKIYFRLGYMVCAFVIGIICIGIGLSDAPKAFTFAAAAYFVIPIVKNIVSLVYRHEKKDLARKILAIVAYVILLLMTIVLAMYDGESESAAVLAAAFPGVVVFCSCLMNIFSLALSNFNNKLLRNIVRKTYAGEIVFGLLLLIVAFSIIIMRQEPNIQNFGDALWYCFMLVTTIGFGDLTSVTVIGRLLSVVLGLYGIVVVAILTSIIVNFYSEVKNVDENELAKEEQKEDLPDAAMSQEPEQPAPEQPEEDIPEPPTPAEPKDPQE